MIFLAVQNILSLCQKTNHTFQKTSNISSIFKGHSTNLCNQNTSIEEYHKYAHLEAKIVYIEYCSRLKPKNHN